MHRIFGEKSDISGNVFRIPMENRHHLGRVIKLKPGEVFEAVVENSIYELEYVDYDTANILSFKEISEGAGVKINLYFGILKGEKTDLIIQKCTELGVTDFYPVMAARTISDVSKKEEAKRARWQKISDEASKQSKGIRMASVHRPIKFMAALDILKNEGFILVPYELEESTSLKEALKSYTGGDISLFIGPEGGFDESEIAELLELNSHVVTLGTKILRAETACIAAAANIIYELDLYNGK